MCTCMQQQRAKLSKIQDDDDVIANACLLQIKPAKNYNLLGCSRKKRTYDVEFVEFECEKDGWTERKETEFKIQHCGFA